MSPTHLSPSRHPPPASPVPVPGASSSSTEVLNAATARLTIHTRFGCSPPLPPPHPGLGGMHNLRSLDSSSPMSLSRVVSNAEAENSGSPSAGRRLAFVIGVAGGTASGKTTVCDHIMQRLNDQCAVMLSQDSFYRGLTPAELEDLHNYNFDHPSAFDMVRLMECLHELKLGRAVEIPIYDFTTHQRLPETQRVEPADVVIIEGILVLHIPEIRDLLNMKIFTDTDDDTRLARRIQRDIANRGRDLGEVIQQYTRFVKPMFDQFVAPSRRHADLIIPWQSRPNIVAIDLITEHIRIKLKQHDLLRLYPNLEVIPSNFQTRGMHTIIRDASTPKHDFVFYADRLNRLVVEAGLGHLPFSEKTVITPTGHPYVGVEFARGLCGVSVIRSGESMEVALRECCQGIKIGKILVHRHSSSASSSARVSSSAGFASPPHNSDYFQPPKEVPDLVYEKLPEDIADRYVLLLDPVLASGSSTVHAIQVLLQRGVKQDKILLLCILAAPEGIHAVCNKFPYVKVITSEIDRQLDGNRRVVPGIGEFGDRYFSE